jgi:C4-type Zn-finger protein
MHSEYPCAHCIEAASMAGVVETPLGTTEIPQVSMTSATAPAATHRWTNVRGFVDEVAEARIWAGFHWRFSTEDGRDTAYKIGHYVATNFMQPITVASR